MAERFDDLELLTTCSAVGVRVSVSGEIDLASVAALGAALDGVVARAAGHVELDLSRTSFCDSVGLGALLAAGRQLEAVGRTLRLVDPSPCVVRLLQLTGTGELFDIDDRRDDPARPDPDRPGDHGPI